MNEFQSFTAKPNELKNKTILITGAGDGIGAQVAKTYASFGATIVLLGRTIPKLEKVYDDIITQGGSKPAIYPLDLEGATPNDYSQLAESIKNEFGCLDGLIHNAAILGSNTPISQFNPILWNKVIQINLTAAFMLTQACLPILQIAQNASIIFTSSSEGIKGSAYWGAYAVSKSAINNLMEILSDELETNTNIRVNALNPSAVRTAMRARAFPAEDPKLLQTAKDIMPYYLYLMSDLNTNITGQIITIS